MCQLLILTFFDGFAVLEPVSSEVLGRSHNCLPMNGRNYPQEYVAILVDLSPQANGIAVNGSWMHRRARMTSEKKGEIRRRQPICLRRSNSRDLPWPATAQCAPSPIQNSYP